jgi:hypothetical protein
MFDYSSGTKGGFIFLIWFQLMSLNQGWALTSSAPFLPNLVVYSLSNLLMMSTTSKEIGIYGGK